MPSSNVGCRFGDAIGRLCSTLGPGPDHGSGRHCPSRPVQVSDTCCQLTNTGLGHDEHAHPHRRGEHDEGSPRSEDPSHRERNQRTDCATTVLDQFQARRQGHGPGHEVKQGQRADEGDDAARDQALGTVPGLADDHRDSNAGQCHREGESPHPEQESAPTGHPLADRAGEIDKGEQDQDRKDHEDHAPDVVSLTPEGVAHRAPDRLQLQADRAQWRCLLFLRCGHPSPPGGPLSGGCPGSHVL